MWHSTDEFNGWNDISLPSSVMSILEMWILLFLFMYASISLSILFSKYTLGCGILDFCSPHYVQSFKYSSMHSIYIYIFSTTSVHFLQEFSDKQQNGTSTCLWFSKGGMSKIMQIKKYVNITAYNKSLKPFMKCHITNASLSHHFQPFCSI